MPRPWPVHLIAVSVLVGLMLFVFQVMGDRLPPGTRLAVLVINLTYAIGSLTLVVVRELSPQGTRLARVINRIVNGTGGVVVVADFWLLAPHATDELMFVMLIYKVGTVTIQVANAVHPPPSKPTLGLAVLALPASMALYFALHWQPVSGPLIAFAVAYGVLAWTLRRLLQAAVDRAYAAQAAAEAALVEVQAQRDARTRFLASASHDLGQPLQAARLSFDQAIRAEQPDVRAAAARRVDWAFDYMEQMLGRVLDHLRLETGSARARLERVALGPVVAEVAEMNEPAARLAGVELRALTSGLAVQADKAMVARILGNMVANALRHSKGRRVLVGARRRRDRVRLWVVDDGVGVTDAEAPGLFEDFVQGSHGDEIRGGFGLGLASSRRMAALMGGEVGLAPNSRRGAAFWLELPAAPANSAA